MGYCSHRLQLTDAAERYYHKALGQGFSAPALYHNLGCLYRSRFDLKKAQSYFEQALALDDGLVQAHGQLALLLAQQFLREQQAEGRPPTAGAAMPERLRQALEHLKRGLPKIEAAPASQAHQIAVVFAMAVRYDAAQAASALTWLERAVAAGTPPTALAQDPLLQPLRNESRYLALQLPHASPRPSSPWIQMIDPIED